MFTKKGKWGRDALWPIRGSKIKEAFIKNASSPHVWVPLIGAGAVHWAGYDKKISKSQVQEKAVFTTPKNTSYWSDHLNNILLMEMYASILFTSSMPEDDSLAKWAWAKTKGGFVTNLASSSSRAGRDVLARWFKRERPNKLDNLSFPSGHSAEAGSRNMLISKNLDNTDMNPYLRTGIKIVNTGMASGTLWARLEGERHYPSDILTGYAVGSFIAGFVFDSLMNLDEGEQFSILPMNNQVSVQYGWRF
jgi:PAP2 superfamily